MEKKSKFKKMATLGIASGLIMAAQAPINANASGVTLAGGGCGGKSCGAKTAKYYTADADDSVQQQTNQRQPQQQGCGGRSAQANQTNRQGFGSGQQQTQLSETELLQQLSPEGKAAYQRLTPEGKALALRLASQSTYKDKNEAVKAAEAASKRSPQKNGY